MNRLEGRIALITGAASGIGRAQALLFAREGAAVVAGDLNGDGAEQVVSEIQAAGGTGLAVKMDVSDEQSVRAAVETAVARFGRIDILSNTAGTFDHYRQTLDTPRELWDKVLAVNLTSLYLVTNAVLPIMLANGGGRVVSIASGAGLMGGGGVHQHQARRDRVHPPTRGRLRQTGDPRQRHRAWADRHPHGRGRLAHRGDNGVAREPTRWTPRPPRGHRKRCTLPRQ